MKQPLSRSSFQRKALLASESGDLPNRPQSTIYGCYPYYCSLLSPFIVRGNINPQPNIKQLVVTSQEIVPRRSSLIALKRFGSLCGTKMLALEGMNDRFGMGGTQANVYRMSKTNLLRLVGTTIEADEGKWLAKWPALLWGLIALLEHVVIFHRFWTQFWGVHLAPRHPKDIHSSNTNKHRDKICLFLLFFSNHSIVSRTLCLPPASFVPLKFLYLEITY